jgi:peroxidase
MIVLNECRHSINAVVGILILSIVSACNQSSGAPPAPPVPPETFAVRSIDGSGNNAQFPDMGAAGTKLIRQVASDYSDDVSQMAGANRTSARAISNIVNRQPATDQRNTLRASDFVWQWGQFLDHDIDLTTASDPVEVAMIPIPMGDPEFDPAGSGSMVMDFERSAYDTNTGTGPDNPRQQLNMITTWIDASNVYGSDANRAAALRANDGTGKLKTSAGDLLPFNVDGLPNAGSTDPDMFLAGDIRANEQAALTSMHTLFVREHNRLADVIRIRQPELMGDQVYQRARRIVGAQLQAITYNEFLPVLLGSGAIAPYSGYKSTVDASICNVFSAALYRFGHSALSPTLLRLNAAGDVIAQGNLPLRSAFFSPNLLIDEGGIEPILRGLSSQVHEDVDVFVIDDVRNMLFGPPGSGGFDLAALNIQRGRDHGLPSYNETRVSYGLAPAQNWSDISSDPDIQDRLSSAYATVDDVDAWVGSLAEDHVSGLVGELILWAMTTQFEAIRDGDRLWYERTLNDSELLEVTTLANIIRRNTSIDGEIQDNVFLVP